MLEGFLMNWKINRRVPEVTEWIIWKDKSWYPLRCNNCYRFPVILVRLLEIGEGHYCCPFCKVETAK